jgi:hypothetical protein
VQIASISVIIKEYWMYRRAEKVRGTYIQHSIASIGKIRASHRQTPHHDLDLTPPR